MEKHCDKIVCPICGKIGKKSTHHILPQRYFHGVGRTFILCRNCHDRLEREITKAEKLTAEQYIEIFDNFCIKNGVDEDDY